MVHPGQTENAWWAWKTPGYILADVVRQLETVSNTPQQGRIGEPSDIAKAVLLLASDDAGWITGQIVQVSGGMRL